VDEETPRDLQPEPLSERITRIEGEISALSAAADRANRTWSAPVLVSIAALLFSFGTTLVSYLHTRQQDTQESRTELRTLVHRLDRIPVENTEAMKKYVDDAETQAVMSGLLNTENSMTAKQAYDVINRIPSAVGASEYLNVANALVGSYLYDKAARLYQSGLKVAADANDEVNLLRAYAALLFSTGDPENGRAQYRLALNVFQKYPTSNNYMVESSHFITEQAWTNAERYINQCSHARDHAIQAETHLSSLPPGPMTDRYRSQFAQMEQTLKRDCKQ
jgi:tetratricopeptide (TPR) repeat protein